MLKTFAQQALETDHGKDIRAIIQEAFECHRGESNIVTQVAAELGTSEPTLRSWCRGLAIDIDSYRQCEPASLHDTYGDEANA